MTSMQTWSKATHHHTPHVHVGFRVMSEAGSQLETASSPSPLAYAVSFQVQLKAQHWYQGVNPAAVGILEARLSVQ